jgi:transcriptional regulator with XRE-family HTH domain
MVTQSGFMSVVVRKSLGRQLRVLRLAAGKSPSDVATSGIASTSKLHRIETGAVPIRLETVWALCQLYAAEPAARERLSEMAKHTNEKGWWEDYEDVTPGWFGMFVELESAASRLIAYDPELVLGLLQTVDYHRALIAVDPERSTESADQQLSLRAKRQRAAFDRPQPLRIIAILGEGVVTRLVGGKAVADEQKQRLLELSNNVNVEVKVLPWETGAHVAMKGAFNILGFDSDDDHPDVVYLETLAGGRYIESEDTVNRFHRNFNLILGQSISFKEYMHEHRPVPVDQGQRLRE